SAWSPAQHVVHVTLAYQNAIADLRGERRAKLLGTRLHRTLWRAVGLTQVVWLRRLPGGVTSPDELVPPPFVAGRARVVGELLESVAAFEAVMREAHASRPHYELRHPYFDMISLRTAALLCAVHTR